MPSTPKISRRENLAETLAIIISMHEEGKSHAQIGDHLKLAKSTMTSIIHRHNRQPEYPLQPTKRAGRPLNLNDRAKRLFIRHIEQNPCDTFKVLGTPSKSGQTLSRVPYGSTLIVSSDQTHFVTVPRDLSSNSSSRRTVLRERTT